MSSDVRSWILPAPGFPTTKLRLETTNQSLAHLAASGSAGPGAGVEIQGFLGLSDWLLYPEAKYGLIYKKTSARTV